MAISFYNLALLLRCFKKHQFHDKNLSPQLHILMNRFYLSILLILFSCNQQHTTTLHYSTKSAKALHLYNKGWEQIMDEGRYAAAEDSYRKALEYDPNFLIGKSVLARLTLNLEERLALFKALENEASEIHGDEKRILEVYTAFTNYTNLRDMGSQNAGDVLQNALQLGEENLRKITHKYPEEIYLKAEYIEMLHALHGPEKALDSLDVLTTATQKENPFLLGYFATMKAELGDYKSALAAAYRLKEKTVDTTIPKPYVVLADVYFKMNQLDSAKSNVDKAYGLDPRNLDASRLKQKIAKKTAQ